MTRPRRTLHRFEHYGHGRYLTFSCHQRLPLFRNDRIKDAFAERLAFVKAKLGFRLYAWVVMPEHVHLLIQTGRADLTVETILHSLKSHFAATVLARWREMKAPILARVTDNTGRQRFWLPGGGYDRNLHSESEWLEKITYIHNNPVRRGLTAQPEQWIWSSARWYRGLHEGPPIDSLW
jgi:putative transposase